MSDNKSMESDLYKEFQAVMQDSEGLPPIALYIAGSARHQTSLSPKIIIKFLQSFYQRVQKGHIPDDLKLIIEASIFEGKIGEAKDVLSSIPEPKYDKKAHLLQLEKEALELIEIMKNEPLYSQKVKLNPPKLKQQPSLICNLCSKELKYESCAFLENCAHMFHPFCIFESLSQQIYNRNSKICCPVKNCDCEIHAQDLENNLTPELFKIYQENELNNLLSSGLVGDIIKCPNIECNERFAISDPNVVNCPGCMSPICGNCKKLNQNCVCALQIPQKPIKKPFIVYKRQCPYCESWVDKNGDNNFSKCKLCFNLFCHDCLKMPGLCKCIVSG